MIQECVLTAQKVSGILGCIKSSLARRSREVTAALFCSPETTAGVLHPALWPHKKVVDLLEHVQRRDMETICSGQKDNSRTRHWNIAILDSFT